MKNKIAKTIKERCDKSPACPAKRVCPSGAIVQDGESAGGIMAMLGGGTAIVKSKKCTGCGKCVEVCPMGAIKMVAA
ncbi:MAG: ATP-binding protein [Elusimicrobiota bacterium]